MDPTKPTIDIARGDPELSRHLSTALDMISEATPSPELKRQIAEIVSGQAGFHTLLESEPFNLILDRKMPQVIEEISHLSEEQVLQRGAEAKLELERLRREGDSEPPTSAHSTPSAPTDPPLSQTPMAAVEQVSAQEPPSKTWPERSPSPGQVIPGTRKPNRDLVVTPDELDEDDEYFQGRRERGWLT